MELSQFFKSVLEQDTSAIVLCDIQHQIVYMNPSACRRYQKRGGASLIGKNLLDCHNRQSQEIIRKTVQWFQSGPFNNSVHMYYHEQENKDVYMIALRDEEGGLIGYYEKHEYRTRDPRPCYSFTPDERGE